MIDHIKINDVKNYILIQFVGNSSTYKVTLDKIACIWFRILKFIKIFNENCNNKNEILSFCFVLLNEF